MTFNEEANEFLTQKNIAVAGVSRGGDSPANAIYKKLRDSGHQVYALNPKVETIEGDTCYPDLKSVPAKLDGLVIVTRPQLTEMLVKDCVELGVPRVWMHENGLMGERATSVSREAVQYARENGVQVIAGGCPMMFLEFGHKCMRWVMGMMGKLPA